jgi:amino acid transporter
MAIGHRIKVHQDDVAWTLDSTNTPTRLTQDTAPDTSKTIPDPKDPTKQIQDPNATIPKAKADGTPVWVYAACDAKGNIVNGTDGKPIVVPTDASGNLMPLTDDAVKAGATMAIAEMNTIDYSKEKGFTTDATGATTFNWHPNAVSVIAPHRMSYVLIQACIAILILVGFESVTSMGEEAKNAKRDIPKAIVASLIIQGGFCYLFEYFAANYFQSSCYTNVTASGSSAPIGDMMQLVGAYWFGNAKAGWWFMMVQATTVFLALIGTTLACINTGARVTYAMGRDEEVPGHFGLLHGKNLTPYRAIWTLATISVFIGIYASMFFLCGPAATSALDSNITDAMKSGIWYKFGAWSNAKAAVIPNSLLIVTLISNFGTFLLYMMTCIVAIVAFREHKSFQGFKHVVIPVFGLVANLACMIFYLVGPFMVAGMSKKEPFIALGFAALWGIYGLIFFMIRSKKLGKTAMITSAPTAVGVGA